MSHLLAPVTGAILSALISASFPLANLGHIGSGNHHINPSSPQPSYVCTIEGKDRDFPREGRYNYVCNRCIKVGNTWACTNVVPPSLLFYE